MGYEDTVYIVDNYTTFDYQKKLTPEEVDAILDTNNVQDEISEIQMSPFLPTPPTPQFLDYGMDFIMEATRQYSPVGIFWNKVCQETSNGTSTIEAIKSVLRNDKVRENDVLDRHIGFYLATHPECPRELFEVLFYSENAFDINQQDVYGKTVLDWAVINGCDTTVEPMVETTSVERTVPPTIAATESVTSTSETETVVVEPIRFIHYDGKKFTITTKQLVETITNEKTVYVGPLPTGKS
jgi:hypothetical protein